MDVERLTELVGKRGAFEVDPSDPLLVVAKMFKANTADALAQLSKVVTDAADQIATTTVLSENNARARSEKIVTEGAKWAAEQIRMAGTDAAKTVVAQLQESIDQATDAVQSMRNWILIGCASTAVSVVAAAVVIFHIVGG